MAIFRTGVSSALTVGGTNGTINVPFPTGFGLSDVALLWLESANEGHTVPAGWLSHPAISIGTAGATTATRLANYYKVIDGTEGGAVSVSGTCDHRVAAMATYSGVDPITPFVVGTGTASTTTATTAVSLPNAAAVTAGMYLLACLATGRDSATASVNSGVAFSGAGAPTTVNEMINLSSATNNGGGLIIWEGTNPTAGSPTFAATITSSQWAGRLLGLNPAILTPSSPFLMPPPMLPLLVR